MASSDGAGTSRVRKNKENWKPVEERILVELYEAELAKVDYNTYALKAAHRNRIKTELYNRTGKKVDGWNKIKNKIDTLRGVHNAWVELMNKTGVSANHRTGVITMDDEWWELREAENLKIQSCHRNPPKYWDAMQRMYGYHDVSTQHMYDVDGAQTQLQEGGVDINSSSDCADGDGGDNNDPFADEYVPQGQEGNTNFPDLSFINPDNTYGATATEPAEQTHEDIPVERTQEDHGRSGRQNTRASPYPIERGESNQHRGTSHVRSTSTNKRGRRKRAFEGTVAAAFQGMTDARLATVSALRPDGFSPPEYAKFKEALAILNSLPIRKYKPFWKASAQLLKEDAWWRNTFLDTPFQSDEDRIGFLESITGVDRLASPPRTPNISNLDNFQLRLSSSSGGSVRSSGSSVGHSSGNSQSNQVDFTQFHPSTAMGQFCPSPTLGFNMPGNMMGAPYFQMMFPQGVGGFPFMPPSPAGQMMQTPGHTTLFNVGASSSMVGTPPTQSGEMNHETRVNHSPNFRTPTRRAANTGYRFGVPTGFGTQPRHLNFMDDGTENQPPENARP